MGQDIHFLERLNRLQLPHVELALKLYRDSELLNWVIQKANIPEPTERVAIALEHGDAPPYLIVTWGGRFVTCLGPGMKPGEDDPVISRGSLDKFSHQINQIRQRLSLDTDSDGVLRTRKLLSRIYRAADEMYREEFLALAAWQPVLQAELLTLLINTAQSVAKRTSWLLSNVRRRPRARHRRMLQSYWRDSLALGPLTMLTCLDSREMFDQLPHDARLRSDLSWMTSVHGVTSTTLHAMWAVGKVGKPLVGGYKRALSQQPLDARFVDLVLGLTVIGLRHRQLIAEVSKAIGSCRPEDHSTTPRWTAILEDFLDKVHFTLDRRQEVNVYVETTGTQFARAYSQLLSPHSAFYFGEHDDVPEDLWLAYCVHHREDWRQRQDALSRMVYCLPRIARSEASELFLPRDLINELHEPWTPDHTLEQLAAQADYVGPQVPITNASPAKPGRNDPCPCGSGKKFKRCCGP